MNILITIGLMMASCALIAGTTLLAKALGTGFGAAVDGMALSPFQVTFGRYVFALATLLVVMAALRPRFTRPALRIHGLRAFCGWSGVTAMFAASALIPLADAVAITFLNPIFTMLFAVLFLGEAVGPRRWGAAALCFAGALLLIRPGLSSFQPLGLIALAAALILGFEAMVVKFLSNREGTLQILFWSNLLGSMFAALSVGFVWVTPTALQWGAMAAIGVMMVGAQALFLLALRRGDVSFVSPLFYGTLIFAAVYDLVFFGVIPQALSLLGITVILTGAILLGLSEHRRARALSPGGTVIK